MASGGGVGNATKRSKPIIFRAAQIDSPYHPEESYGIQKTRKLLLLSMRNVKHFEELMSDL